MTLLLKEDFIFTQYNSITDELCIDILNIFENNIIKNDLFAVNKNSCYEIIGKDYGKIKSFLINELINNVQKYLFKINSINNILNYNSTDPIEFFIKNERYSEKDEDNCQIIKRINWKEKGYKLLNFIWFLNDFDGEILFWKKHIIKPKRGLLIIFPSSWCFPYEKIITKNHNSNIIYGYLYRNNK